MGLSLQYVLGPGGVIPASAWSPPNLAEPVIAPVFLADKIDPLTGELQSMLVGRHPVDAWVVTQLATVHASGAAVLDSGQALGRLKTIDDTTGALIEFELRRLLAPAVARGDIEIVAIVGAAGEDEGEPFDLGAGYVEYRNLRLPTVDPLKAVFAV